MQSQTAEPLSGIAKKLIQDNIITLSQAKEYCQTAREQKTSLVRYLVINDIADQLAVATAVAEEISTPLFDIDAINYHTLPKDIINHRLIIEHQFMPLYQRGNRLFIAVSDPSNLRAQEEIKFHTGLVTETVLVEHKKLEQAIKQHLEQDNSFNQQLTALEGSNLADFDIEVIDEEKDEVDQDTEQPIDETPIVRFINKVLIDAITQGASDIHFEPYENHYRIRFRTDGILKEINRPPISLAPRLAARIKVMSQMDISERRLPQDGRIKMKLSKTRAIDFRVNALPTLYGEKIVLRILDPSSANMGIDKLGYEDDQKKLYLKALQSSQGLILVTGPTGSGKTVSLYSGLNILNEDKRNISSAEDPVEINMEGINQVHVSNKIGLTFAETLRAFLRQDPDVIMVGEIRDLETAEIAIKAAQTGHLVMSTLHTNSAADTITRLLSMGIPSYNVATALSLVIAQRLARRLCEHCSKTAYVTEHSLREQGFSASQIHTANIKEAVGCPKCIDGYKGRLGIYEVVKITPELKHIIMSDGNAITLAETANKIGYPNLRQSALHKAALGLTSLEEINRVI